MVQAVILAFALGACLLFILQRGFRYSWNSPYASGYHIWALQASENEPRYLGCWDDSYAAIEVAEDWLKDKRTLMIMVRKSGGLAQEFTAEDVQGQHGLCLM